MIRIDFSGFITIVSLLSIMVWISIPRHSTCLLLVHQVVLILVTKALPGYSSILLPTVDVLISIFAVWLHIIIMLRNVILLIFILDNYLLKKIVDWVVRLFCGTLGILFDQATSSTNINWIALLI